MCRGPGLSITLDNWTSLHFHSNGHAIFKVNNCKLSFCQMNKANKKNQACSTTYDFIDKDLSLFVNNVTILGTTCLPQHNKEMRETYYLRPAATTTIHHCLAILQFSRSWYIICHKQKLLQLSLPDFELVFCVNNQINSFFLFLNQYFNSRIHIVWTN